MLTRTQLTALALIRATRTAKGLTAHALALIGRHQTALRDLGLIDYAPERGVAWTLTDLGRQALAQEALS